MKGYVRSYILGTILIAAAFITFFVKTDALPLSRDKETNRTASWLLFLGGAILIMVGSRERNNAVKDKENKNK
jgi:hypothetical protein